MCDALDTPPASVGLPQPVPGNEGHTRWKVSAARPPCAVGVGDFVKLCDRSRPAMAHRQRQRIGMLRTHVDEMDVHAVDAPCDRREAVQPRFAGAPVIGLCPARTQLLHAGQRRALRPVVHRGRIGPARGDSRRFGPASCAPLAAIRNERMVSSWCLRGIEQTPATMKTGAIPRRRYTQVARNSVGPSVITVAAKAVASVHNATSWMKLPMAP